MRLPRPMRVDDDSAARRRRVRDAGRRDRARPRGEGDIVQQRRAHDRAGAGTRRAGLAGAARTGSRRGGARRRNRQRAAQRRVRPARSGRPLVQGARPAVRRRSADAAAHVPRSHAAASRRADARRLRRQCEPRAAYPARLALGLHRHAAGKRARGRERARPLPRHHEDAGRAHGAADRGPAFIVARRVDRAHASRGAGRSRARGAAGGRRAADARDRP